MWQLEHENRLLRQLLMASRSSCHDPEASLQVSPQIPEAQEHRMTDGNAWTVSEEVEDEATDFQEYLALVGSSHTCPRHAPERPLQYIKCWVYPCPLRLLESARVQQAGCMLVLSQNATSAKPEQVSMLNV